MSDEWGPWVQHDGKGCPVRVGQYIAYETEDRFGTISKGEGMLTIANGRSWDWSNYPEFIRVLRYRIRKPRGLTILENLIAEIPEEVAG